MGIPNLTRSLTPYATPIHLSPDPASQPSASTSTSPKTIPSLVIDGPGLIFHIYHRLLAQKVRRAEKASTYINAVDAQPSPAEVSRGVGWWLAEVVVGRRVDVRKIYFDGALPISKRGVRLERMEAQRRRLEEWAVGFRGGFKVRDANGSGSVMEGDVAELFAAGEPIPEKYRGLPENPFMVSATIEDLKGYWTWGMIKGMLGGDAGASAGAGADEELAFAHLVEVVPNEADIYCAEVARQPTEPVAVLTSDSDLLVHDLGEHGRVVFYESLELSSPDDRGGRVIKAMELHPASIAARLGVVSLPRLAFEMKLERGVSLNEAVRRAKDSSGRVEGSAKFKAFMEEYEPLPVSAVEGERRTSPWMRISNPKLGELVAQFEVPRLRGKDGNEGYHVYLPILIEDTTRRSAWYDGVEIRRVAYSILNMSFDGTSRKNVLYEFSRRGARIAYNSLPLTSSIGDLAVELENTLLSKLRLIQTLLPISEHPVQFWTLFALFEIYSSDGNVPSSKELMNFLTMGRAGEARLTWDDIHLYARMLGVLYSIKGRAEVVGVVGAGAKGEEWEAVREVKSWMECLPRGSELFCDKSERGRLFNKSWVGEVVGGLVALVRESCETESQGAEETENGDAEGWVDSGKGKGKKRARRKSGNEIEKETSKKKGKNDKKGENRFEILAGMG